MSDVIFTFDPGQGQKAFAPLTISTGANNITWGYGLNAVAFPTYGGEVVQVLSCYVDDLQIQGDVDSYAKLEEIYKWFLQYMQRATQKGDFSEATVTFSYPERGWSLQIRPNSLPAFRYGTEVVAPSWQMSAAVVESDPSMDRVTHDLAHFNKFDFNRLSAGIGYSQENPFTDPAAASSTYDLQTNLTDVTDFYTNLIPAYLQGNFTSLIEGFQGSKPSSGNQNQQGNQNQKGNANRGNNHGNGVKGATGTGGNVGTNG